VKEHIRRIVSGSTDFVRNVNTTFGRKTSSNVGAQTRNSTFQAVTSSLMIEFLESGTTCWRWITSTTFKVTSAWSNSST
jgi:hypothetical protein